MQTENVKQQVLHLLSGLPEDTTWEEFMYRMYVLETIQAGIQDSEAGKTIDVDEVRRRFGL